MIETGLQQEINYVMTQASQPKKSKASKKKIATSGCTIQ
jgi:hypothetical protein